MGFRNGPNLSQQRKLIPIVPARHNFAIRNPSHGHTSNVNFAMRRRNSQIATGVGHVCRPAHGHLVIVAKHVFHRGFNVRERGADLLRKRDETLRAVHFGFVAGLAEAGGTFIEQFANSFHAALIPDFRKPALHERDIFFSSHMSSCTSSGGIFIKNIRACQLTNP